VSTIHPRISTISWRIFVAEETNIVELNESLPEDIKVFAVKRVTKGFNSKSTCDARSYSYTLPTFTFTADDEEYQESSFRLSPERFEKLNSILQLYVGTKNFHNFTIRKEAFDPSAKRFIIDFHCEQPFIPDNTEIEFARLKIKGQSFMMHQIRKMVGLVIAIMRGYKEPSIIEQAVRKEKLLVPQAPGLGLVLDSVHYDRYNERYGGDGQHETLTWEAENEAVEDFFQTKIMSTIIDTELKEESMNRWIGRLKTHEYEKVEGEKESNDKDGYMSD
jgi:tRNA pseudouridine38-40 synthase